MLNMFNSDVIVVGAGPCGIACALEIAKQNRKVVLIDRASYPGSKNMYGGAIYDTALREVFGDEVNFLPYERIITSQSWGFLTSQTSFEINYKNQSSKNAYAITRFNLEKWMIEIAKKNGVYYIPNTLVTNLIKKDNYIIGVETEFEKYYAPITILADGANSLLAKKIGLRKDFKPKDMILAAKEVIKLDKATIEKRFNLKSDLTNGVSKMLFGGIKKSSNLFMMSFLYTFKDTISIGCGANLEDLAKNKINVNDLLDEIKKHPDISPLIEDGRTIEYSAHLIPETGYNKMPKLTDNGVMLCGDACGFVNSVHSEGTNFALISGKLAAKVALCALGENDFSQKKLNLYKKELENSFILKDLYSYRNVINSLHKRTNSLINYYPEKIRELFEIITNANCISKSQQLRNYAKKFIFERNIFELLNDIKMVIKCAFEVFFGK